MNSHFQDFCDELDALVQRWADKHHDDSLTGAEVVGALMFKAHVIMAGAQKDAQEEEK